MLDVGAMRARLPGRRIEWRESTDSTMLVAAEFAGEHGTIVGAEEQTAGVGRHGRRWHSEAGAGLYVTFVLRLELAADQLPLAMLALGLATRDAIADAAGLAPDLRWPNDILIGEKKCSGILAQLEGGAILAGIGINVNQTEFPTGLDTPATSLKLAGASVAREDLLVTLAHAVDRSCKILSEEGAAPMLQRFTVASTYASGRRVRVQAEGRRIEGVTCGLDASGFLRVREDNGRETTILAGGVRAA